MQTDPRALAFALLSSALAAREAHAAVVREDTEEHADAEADAFAALDEDVRGVSLADLRAAVAWLS